MAALYDAAGEPEASFQALLAARRADPRDAEVAAALGGVHENRREFDLAIAEWRRALRLGESDSALAVSLASLYVRLGWSRDAEALLATARRRTPLDPGVRLALAMLHVQNGRVREAESELRAAARSSPDGDRVESLLANVFAMTSRPAEALAAARRALAGRPNEPEYLIQLGELLLQERGAARVAEADALFRRALERAPGNARVWSGLARALRRQGRPREAEEILAPLCARPRPDPSLLREWGGVLTELGQTGRGREALARATAREREVARLERARIRLSGNPGSPAARRDLGVLYLEHGDAPRAIAELRRYLEARPTDAEARQVLRRALRAAGRG